MSEERYVSRDKAYPDRYALFEKKPIWLTNKGYYVLSDYPGAYVLLDISSLDYFFPQLKLKPGQLAKVNREVKDGVVTLTLGEIIESH